MNTVRLISLALVLVFARGEDEVCTDNNLDFKICKKGNTLTRITHDHRIFSGKFLSLEIERDIIISEDALISLNLQTLTLACDRRGVAPETPLPSVSLSSNLLASLTNLTDLKLENVEIDPIGGLLRLPNSLDHLIVEGCELSEVPSDTLATAPKLVDLSLRRNRIQTIKPNAFAGLKHLKKLGLSQNNALEHLEEGCFNGLDKLESLELGENYITLRPGLFKGLNNLKRLYLSKSFNGMGFEPSLLQDVPNLVALYARYNGLSSLQPGMFDALQNLENLFLTGNTLTHIPKGVFNQLKSLKQLNLGNNSIESIEPAAFSGLNLTSLTLSLNSLENIKTGIFNDLNVTNRLSLSDNLISTLDPGAFRNLNTQRLDLAKNRLTEVHADDFLDLNADELNLSENSITTIAPNAFSSTKLNLLELVSNPIKEADKSGWGLSKSAEISME
ncbi:leucine-rich repeat-containing protein 15 [Fopius arisanus]|uniref:Leucine-rich repeat-containing protein 15 n=1 Tax=Fopius arisanus TaxID=64838 RepID=A0A9R1TF45_9HYME|nr:PREDICTED: leucine-rich repeat-containing protein 15-like [Fopius arisanus]